MTTPVRIQLSRKKGFNLQAYSRSINGLPAMSVARPTRWGNPWYVGMWRGYKAEDAVKHFRRWLMRDPGVRSAENVFGKPPSFEDIKTELRGKNLSCWCSLDKPCHADVLLKLANPS
jgi:hypothetical protein